jgi:diacylglycerol kinase
MDEAAKGLIKSFGNAFKGLWILFSTQRNAIIHLVLWDWQLSLEFY